MANTARPGERWPALAAEPAALAWLGIRSDLGLAPRTLDAYSRGLSEYLVFCAAVSTDPLTAGRDHVARYVRELTQRPPRRARVDTASSSVAGPRLANATVQQRLTAVRLFYDHLIEEGVRDNNPVGRGRYAPGAHGRQSPGLGSASSPATLDPR
jgi:site-specific recombinase XerD